MRGQDERSEFLFSDIAPEHRVPKDHPLRAVRQLTDAALERLSPRFRKLYSDIGRPSIPPEQLLRALLVQVLYSVRSERLLMEQLQYNLLFRWFVGIGMDEPVWDHSTFSKNRDRLLDGHIAQAFFDEVVAAARASCCWTSISRSTARCSRPGRVIKACSPRTARRVARGAGTPTWTSSGTAARMRRMRRRPTRMRGWRRRRPGNPPNWRTTAMSVWTIATASWCRRR